MTLKPRPRAADRLGSPHPHPFKVELRVTRDEWARLDMLSAQLGAPRWRVMRLALHMLFEQEQRANAARERRVA